MTAELTPAPGTGSAPEDDSTGAQVIPFGRYRGLTIVGVSAIDPSYVLRMISDGRGSAELRASAAAALIERGYVGGQRSIGRRTTIDMLVARPWLWAPAFGALLLALYFVSADGRGTDPPLPPHVDSVPVEHGSAADLGGRTAQSIESATTVIAAQPSAAAPSAAPALDRGSSDVARATDDQTSARPEALRCGARLEGAIDAMAAAEHVDEFRAVEFRVAGTKDTGRVTFLNSHHPYQGHFYVAIFPGDYGKFPAHPASYFDGKCIVVQGSVELYRGVPQIVLRSPDDVRVLPD